MVLLLSIFTSFFSSNFVQVLSLLKICYQILRLWYGFYSRQSLTCLPFQTSKNHCNLLKNAYPVDNLFSPILCTPTSLLFEFGIPSDTLIFLYIVWCLWKLFFLGQFYCINLNHSVYAETLVFFFLFLSGVVILKRKEEKHCLVWKF